MKKFRQIVRGVLDYFFEPELYVHADSGFNGQVHRQNIFKTLMSDIAIDLIVECGTFRGVSTQYMRRHSDCEIISVEQHPRYFGFAKTRLFFAKNTRLFLMDSVEFLRTMMPLHAKADSTIFFYLDAHWETHLPLREELELILRSYPRAVIMIDDFQVPDDAGYCFDDYGEGKVLNMKYIQDSDLPAHHAFFPSAPSGQESGSKRGCVVLTAHPQFFSILSKNETLREWKGSRSPS